MWCRIDKPSVTLKASQSEPVCDSWRLPISIKGVVEWWWGGWHLTCDKALLWRAAMRCWAKPRPEASWDVFSTKQKNIPTLIKKNKKTNVSSGFHATLPHKRFFLLFLPCYSPSFFWYFRPQCDNSSKKYSRFRRCNVNFFFFSEFCLDW